MTEVEIQGEFIKLDQLLKFIGIAQTGGHAKMIILDGFVSVNDEIVFERGRKIKKGDIVEIDGTEKFIMI